MTAATKQPQMLAYWELPVSAVQPLKSNRGFAETNPLNNLEVARKAPERSGHKLENAFANSAGIRRTAPDRMAAAHEVLDFKTAARGVSTPNVDDSDGRQVYGRTVVLRFQRRPACLHESKIKPTHYPKLLMGQREIQIDDSELDTDAG